jgi:hypothetical protein
MMTLDKIRATYAPGITQEQLDDIRERQRIAKGPPFRMTIDYPQSPRTPELLAQAELDDLMGNVEAEEGTYITLQAQTREDAISEARMLWRDRDQDGAIGYAVWRNDWGCVDGYSVG